MTKPDDLVAALAQLADHDVDELIDDVRREGRALAQRHLVEAYADALVRAVGRRGDEPASADVSRLRPSTPPSVPPGCYVYAIVAGAGAHAATAEPGVEPGGEVAEVTVDGLTAVVSDVDVDAFRRGCDEADVSEAGWLANAVRAHERTVVAAFRSAPTLPIRFGVVHPDRAAVQRMLREHAAEIGGELERLTGTAEWTLKVVVDRERLESHLSTDDGAPAPADGAGGRAFLLRERSRRDLRAQAQSFVRERVERLTTAVGALARDTVDLPRSGGETPPVYAAALLVARADDARLTTVVDRVAAETSGAGLTVTLDGPWPPFHFASLRLEAGDG